MSASKMRGAQGTYSKALMKLLVIRIAASVAVLFLFSTQANSQLAGNFYRATCPAAETIVRNAVNTSLQRDRGLGAGLLRMHFHDCFVKGCDGSVLIDSTPGNPSEKEAGANQGSLRGFEVIDAAKAQLEARCPGLVSCADTLAFAARDSVFLLGGPLWQIRSGRRDSNSSSSVSDVGDNLPGPSSNFQQLTQSFAVKGLTREEMITLSGAHTIGQSLCAFFTNRLYNFNSTNPQDPSLNPQYAARLKALCPQNNSNPNAVAPLDPLTPNSFDNSYFTNVVQGRVLFTSDQVLFTDASSAAIVKTNSANGSTWLQKFAQAMIKMSEIGVLTGQQGTIRINCRVANS